MLVGNSGLVTRRLDCNRSAADAGGVTTSPTERFHGFLSLQARGVVALPPALRKRYQLDQPGAQVEVTEREDGVLEVRPVLAVPATEAWFWAERWQAGEREVDEHVRHGRVRTMDTTEDFIDHLAALDDEAATAEAADDVPPAGVPVRAE